MVMASMYKSFSQHGSLHFARIKTSVMFVGFISESSIFSDCWMNCAVFEAQKEAQGGVLNTFRIPAASGVWLRTKSVQESVLPESCLLSLPLSVWRCLALGQWRGVCACACVCAWVYLCVCNLLQRVYHNFRLSRDMGRWTIALDNWLRCFKNENNSFKSLAKPF